MADVTAQSSNARRPVSWADDVFRYATAFCAALILFMVGGIAITLFQGSLPAMEAYGLGFVTTESWNPVTEKFGGLGPIYGTLVDVRHRDGDRRSLELRHCRIHHPELSPGWLKRPLSTAIELLAGIPSIIYGIWGLFVLAPFLQEHIYPYFVDTLGPCR